MVEIAVRALSPGINDPFTAIRCVDQLAAALCRLAERAAIALPLRRRAAPARDRRAGDIHPGRR